MITRRAATNGLLSAATLLGVGANAQTAAISGPLHGDGGDVRAFRHFAETTHPRGLALASDAAWTAYWDTFANDADSLSYPAFVARTLGGLAQFKDGHSTIWMGALMAGGFDLRLPVGAHAFYDGLYIISAKGAGAPMLGARITRVGSLETRDLMTRMKAIWPANNPAWTHHDAGFALLPAMLSAFGAIAAPDAEVSIEGVSPAGRIVRARLRGAASGGNGRTSLARPRLRQEAMAADAGSANYAKLLDNGALYVSFDDLTVSTEQSVAFTQAVFAAMEDRSARRLVIDLRRNGGGDNFLGEGFRRGVERSRFNRPGGLYVLIGPQTFSAAQNLANRIERETFAIFVGEPTGGSPNHYGDAGDFTGPASGLAIHVSTLPWFDSLPMDHRQWIFPDVPSPARFADFAAGRDPALDLALTHADDADANELTHDRIFYFSRPSQSGEWKPFWLA